MKFEQLSLLKPLFNNFNLWLIQSRRNLELFKENARYIEIHKRKSY